MKKTKNGFTLIEVLIALAVLGIAITALVSASSSSIRNLAYIRDKTIANWVAIDIVNQVQLDLIKPPIGSHPLQSKSDMYGKEWPWNAMLNKTENANIHRIIIDVFDGAGKQKLYHLEAFKAIEQS